MAQLRHSHQRPRKAPVAAPIVTIQPEVVLQTAQNELVFTVPPGIGDISWVYSKIIDIAKERPVSLMIENSPPPRSKPFVDLLPYVKNLGYAPPGIGSPHHEQRETDLAALPNGHYKLFVNEWLEQGIRIENIFPRQKTHYHYDLKISDQDKNLGSRMLDVWMKGHPKIGLYASNYHHGPMGFWDYPEWAELASGIRDIYPNVCFVCIGAEYDKKTKLLYNHMKITGFNVLSAVGTYNIGATLELIRRLDYFFAFPSGLGIMADVLNIPCTMWYWKGCTGNWGGCMDTFINSYADPENVASRKHINLFYNTVQESLDVFAEFGIRWIKNC